MEKYIRMAVFGGEVIALAAFGSAMILPSHGRSVFGIHLYIYFLFFAGISLVIIGTVADLFTRDWISKVGLIFLFIGLVLCL